VRDVVSLARFVIARRWWVLAVWVLLAVAGGIAAPGARIASFASDPSLMSADSRTAVLEIYPRAASGPQSYPQALAAIQEIARAGCRSR
jgi:RND superfamily putative drug exporter